MQQPDADSSGGTDMIPTYLMSEEVQRPVEVPPDQHAAAETEDPVAKKKEKGKKKDGQPLGSSRGIETMFRTSYMTHVNLSEMADNKANIMISINGIIMSIILASISPRIAADPVLLIPSSVLLIGCLISIVYAVLAARPRVNRSELTPGSLQDKRANILFFGQFASLRLEEFELGMSDLLRNTDDIYHQMIRDLYSLGRVLSRKFDLLRVSYTAFMFGLIGGVTLFILVYLLAIFSSPA